MCAYQSLGSSRKAEPEQGSDSMPIAQYMHPAHDNHTASYLSWTLPHTINAASGIMEATAHR